MDPEYSGVQGGTEALDPRGRHEPLIRVGIIGGGFAALMVYVVLRFRGVPSQEIRVFTPDMSPERSWDQFASVIGLETLRSESIAHFFPADSPGLATVEACRTWSLKPLLLSWFDRYRPTRESFLWHTRCLARQTGFYQSIVSSMIARVIKEGDTFGITDERGVRCGTAQHVIFAVGHGAPMVPAPVVAFRETHGFDGRVVHAYEEKQYAPPRTTLVLGDGLTAGTEWVNVLQAGGAVIAVSRQGFSFGQPLNTPRRYFSRRGISPYRRQAPEVRLQELGRATRGTIPAYPAWMRLFRRAQAEGRLELVQGELLAIEDTETGALRCTLRLPDGHALRTVLVHQVIAATGFLPPATHPLLAQLVADHGIPTSDGILKIRDDFCIDELTAPASCAAVIGPAAAWALPSADSLGGMKIAAHMIANHLVGPEFWNPTDLFRKTVRWATLLAGKELS